MLQNNPELKSKIDQLWNKFWGSEISNRSLPTSRLLKEPI